MKKYIDVDLLKSELCNFLAEEDIKSNERYYWEIFDIINSQPAADVKEVWHGEWIEKEHWIPLPRDYEVSYDSDYDDCYDEKTHSWKEKYWHCNCCNYEASRSMKPWFDYCPKCGVKMKKITEVEE